MQKQQRFEEEGEFNIVDIVPQKIKQEGLVSVNLSKFLGILRQYYQRLQIAELSDTIPCGSGGALLREVKIEGCDKSAVDPNLGTTNLFAELDVTFQCEVLDRVVASNDTSSNLNNIQSSKCHSSRFSSAENEEQFQGWSFCTLFRNIENRVVLKKWTINSDYSTLLKTSNSEDDVQLNNDKKLKKDETKDSNSRSEESEVYVGVIDKNIAFMSSKPGMYTIHVSILASLENKDQGNHSTSTMKKLKLDIEKAVKNSLKFKIPEKNVQVHVVPSIDTKVESEKSTLHDFTVIHCKLPPTRHISIRWIPEVKSQSIIPVEQQKTLDFEEEKGREKALPLLVNVDQACEHTIGEGLIRTKSKFKFQILNGTLNSMEFIVNSFDRPFKLINAQGHSIQKTYQESIEEGDEWLEGSECERHFKKKIHLQFSRGIENHYFVELILEVEMGGTSAQINIPTIIPQNITRGNSMVAIIAKTNVEIKEKECKYMQRIDASEFPGYLHLPSILYAYKVVETNHQLSLDVLRHNDAAICCSLIDTMDYKITHSNTFWLHQITLKCANTAKQFIRIMLPDVNGDIWSTVVNGSSVKPSSETKDDQKYILIPLSKSEQEIDFTFTSTAQPFENSGSASFELARFDIPVLKLEITASLPSNYHYGEFSGDALEVTDSWKKLGYPETKSLSVKARKSTHRSKEMEFEVESPVCESFLQSSVKPVTLRRSQGDSSASTDFKLAKYLMMENTPLSLAVSYKLKKKSWFSRRDVSTGYRIFIISIAVLVIAVLLSVYLYLPTIPIDVSST